MHVIVGLGNPRKIYEKTRHNAGFMAVDFLRDRFAPPTGGLSEWKLAKKQSALVSIGEIENKKIILAKPQTFMNSSGSAVQSLMKFYGLTPDALIVIHDDIDIPFGEVRAASNSGAAGHHGVESIIETLGTKNFRRLRIGILPSFGKPPDVDSFVLQKFSKKELANLQSVFENILSQGLLG